MKVTQQKARCAWASGSPAEEYYHDHEWGVPQHDDRALFELMNLEGAQAGLSWRTVLMKRENYRRAFANFDIGKVARFSDARLEKLLLQPGLIRNRLKIFAVRTNALAAQRAVKEYGSLDAFLWSFVDAKPIQNEWNAKQRVPAKTAVSDRMAKGLKAYGFTFVGSTICYAFMQATGMVNDHLTVCFRHAQCKRLR